MFAYFCWRESSDELASEGCFALPPPSSDPPEDASLEFFDEPDPASEVWSGGGAGWDGGEFWGRGLLMAM